MKKMIVINDCWGCPHHRVIRIKLPLYCEKVEADILYPDEIPEGCPLPDAPEKEE